jgi:chromosome segregation protein
LAQEFVSKQREATEALLREVVELEERLKSEARAAEARSEWETCKATADSAASLVQQAEHEAAAASERHKAVAAECVEADQRVVAAREDAESVKAKLAELQQQLQETQIAFDEASSTLSQREAYAKESADKLNAAAHDVADASELVETRQAAWAAAEKEAQAAQEQFEQLKSELTPQDVAAINSVHVLAARIAEEALKLK